MQSSNGSANGENDVISKAIYDMYNELFQKRLEVMQLQRERYKAKDKSKADKEILAKAEIVNDLQKNFNEIVNTHSRMINYQKRSGVPMKDATENLLKAIENMKSNIGDIVQTIPKD